MSFVTEVISEEDSKAYKIESIWKKYNKNTFYPDRRRWTIDRDRNVFLLRISAGRADLSNISRFILVIGEADFLIELTLDTGIGIENNMKYTWSLERTSSLRDSSVSESELKKILKSALIEYGLGLIEDKSIYDITFNF